jgi:hypothetical protein
MLRAVLLCLLLLSSVAAVPGLEPPLPAGQYAPDATVQAMLNRVQGSTLSNYVAGLSGEQAVTIGGVSFILSTRSTTAAIYIEQATLYAYEHFQSLGLVTSYQVWQGASGPRRNVVAEQPGTDAACIYLLTAHLDDTSANPNSRAPGADDNASGVAGVWAAADILSQHAFACTLRYVLFSGEEQGLLGSAAYARAAAARGDPIRGVLNLDMIGYNSPNSPATVEMDIRTGPQGAEDQLLSDMLRNVIATYQLGLIPLVYASNDAGSDQFAFWQAGFPGVEIIEDWDDHSPYYHTTADRLATLNLPYFTAYVKAIVGTAAHLARLTSPYRAFLPVVR